MSFSNCKYYRSAVIHRPCNSKECSVMSEDNLSSSMDRRPRKSFVQSLHDRSGRSKSLKSSRNNRDAQYMPNDYIDDLVQRVERLENECIRYNKVLTMYIDRIEELEGNLEKVNEQINKQSSKPESLLRKDTVIDESSSKISTWVRITKFFTHRPSLDSLKKRNIYKNEACFDTEIENVIKHERYRTVPKIVVECVQLIEDRVKITRAEGLYRTCGDYVEIQKIRFSIDANDFDCLKEVKDVHTIVGVLKLFFREIKAPLIKSTEIKAFIGTPREWTLGSIRFKLDILQKLVKTLPEINRDTLGYFMKHLCRLTRMPLQYTTAQSLAVSLTPTIFHITLDHRCDLGATLKENTTFANCLEILIEYSDRIFETPNTKIYKHLSRCISCPGLADIILH